MPLLSFFSREHHPLAAPAKPDFSEGITAGTARNTDRFSTSESSNTGLIVLPNGDTAEFKERKHTRVLPFNFHAQPDIVMI
ncbi:MAG: hypothetical protein L7W43_08585 [Rubripirellula sp.]|nr:hypothetical protein [Rubripirellula sp.]